MSLNSDYNEINWFLLAKYFSGNTSVSENNLIHKWLEESPKNRSVFESSKKAWEASTTTRQVWDTEKAWNEFKRKAQKENQNLADQVPSYSGFPTSRKPRSSWSQFLSIAAILFVSLTLGLIYYQNSSSIKPLRVEKEIPAAKEFVNKKGQRYSILQLPDNSIAYLGAESRLVIQPHFNRNERHIYIEGEAYFEIAHNKDRPFVVETKYGLVKVLGTKFNINTYSETDQQSVAVTEGKVAFSSVSNSAKTTILTAGNLGILPFGSDKISVKKIDDIDQYIGWTKNKLVLKNTPLSSVIKKIERWYGVDSELATNDIAAYKLTSTFKDQPLEEVLEAITLSIDITYTKEGNTYVFSAK